jgi:hypothetical protein
MKKEKNLVWILLAYGLIFLAFKYKNKLKGSVSVQPIDKGEFPSAGTDYFPSDVPDYQN